MPQHRSLLLLSFLLVVACGDDTSAREDDASMTPDEPSTQLDAGADARMDATVEAGPPVNDAAPRDAVADAAADANPPAPQRPACPSDNACKSPNFPCAVSDDDAGYTCLGQYAAWPMPDSQPGAKTAPRYTLRAADNVVLDEVTGLLWQHELPIRYTGCSKQINGRAGDGCTYTEARAYCEQLDLAGRRWRLPSRVEMESLIDNAAPLPGVRIDPDYFPDTPETSFWIINQAFECGATFSPRCKHIVLGGFTASESDPDEALSVRCVHSERVPNAPPTGRFSLDAQTDVVRDSYTKLEWLRTRSTATPRPAQADAYCASREGGWRLPTIKELLTLNDAGRTDSADDPVFALQEPFETYWSSTEAIAELGRYFYVAGGAISLPETLIDPTDPVSQVFDFRARCVR